MNSLLIEKYGNFQPSSSSQAAELLASSGAAATGFIGFGQSPKYVPASSSLDDMDTSLDSDFRLVLRKLSKRDATTKIKVLIELCLVERMHRIIPVAPHHSYFKWYWLKYIITHMLPFTRFVVILDNPSNSSHIKS